MSPYPPQYLIYLESFDAVVPLKTERGHNLLGVVSKCAFSIIMK